MRFYAMFAVAQLKTTETIFLGVFLVVTPPLVIPYIQQGRTTVSHCFVVSMRGRMQKVHAQNSSGLLMQDPGGLFVHKAEIASSAVPKRISLK